ncbi:MAG TPA: 6-carboxytetrahydropterin synthase [Acidimicrobiales bacterium]|nr:6-carboxytetrahydropterin synthase [Acidimicrobiales bacterium]
MFAVEVRDRIMIAHSLPDPFFGPAQHMHGATFVVDVAFFREELTRHNVVVDIGAALDRAFAAGVPYLVNVLTDPADVYPRSSNLG